MSYADGPDGKRRLSRIAPMDEIHNGSPEHRIRNVTAGVRRRGHVRGGHQFEWNEAIIEPLRNAIVRDVEIPPEMFRDLFERRHRGVHRLGALHGRKRPIWEVWRNAHTKTDRRAASPPADT